MSTTLDVYTAGLKEDLSVCDLAGGSGRRLSEAVCTCPPEAGAGNSPIIQMPVLTAAQTKKVNAQLKKMAKAYAMAPKDVHVIDRRSRALAADLLQAEMVVMTETNIINLIN